jgi:hypothetical protein
MKYVRCYIGKDGESHYEDVEFVIPTGKIGNEIVSMSKYFPVNNMAFVEIKEDSPNVGWHITPNRCFVIYLSGKVEIIVSDGEIRTFKSGDIVLYEDTEGKGHLSKNGTDRFFVIATLM